MTKEDTKKQNEYNEEDEKKKVKVLDEGDIDLLKRYGMGPYSENIKKIEEENKELI